MKIVIIGAGIGGMGAAIRLAKEGHEVTILEKNSVAGGRCGQIIRDGHKFDCGPTFFIFPKIYRKVFESLGENIEDHLKLHKIDPISQVVFEDGSKILLTQNLALMKSQLESFEKGSFKSFEKLIDKSRVHYNLTMEKILSRDFIHLYEFFSFKNLPLLYKGNIFQTHEKFLKQYFKDIRLRMAFSYHDSYVGLSPFSAPAMFSSFLYSELTEGVWYPEGGMYEVVRVLAKVALKNKVIFKFNSPVKKINKFKDKIVSVEVLGGDIYKADIFISNADLAYTYDNLLEDKRAEKLFDKRYACSVLTFFWGLKKPVPKLHTHNIFLSDSYRKSYEEVINKHSASKKPHFYVHLPEGKDSLVVHVPVGHIDQTQKQDWKEIKGKARKYVLGYLAEFGIDIEKNIKFELTSDPNFFRDNFNMSYGSAIGLHHNLLQMGYFRPNKKDNRYKNLFFVGSNTHPGCGVPSVLLSSQFVSERILSGR